jgi:hypothetical protein
VAVSGCVQPKRKPLATRVYVRPRPGFALLTPGCSAAHTHARTHTHTHTHTHSSSSQMWAEALSHLPSGGAPGVASGSRAGVTPETWAEVSGVL